jgi:hypothetical protein
MSNPCYKCRYLIVVIFSLNGTTKFPVKFYREFVSKALIERDEIDGKWRVTDGIRQNPCSFPV